jgi:hypothetical protein
VAECIGSVPADLPHVGSVDHATTVWRFRVDDEEVDWDWSTGPPPVRRLSSIRRPQSTAASRHVPVEAHSVTTGHSIRLESGLEHDLLRALDRQHDVVWFAAQPARLTFPVKRKGRPFRHTPDLLSQKASGAVTVWDARAEPKQGEDFKLKAALTAGACAHVGWGYRVFAGYGDVLRANLMWLEAYRRTQPWYEPARELLSELLTGEIASVGTVLAADAGSGHLISAMWHYLWRGGIDCELGEQITPETVLTAGHAEADRA